MLGQRGQPHVVTLCSEISGAEAHAQDVALVHCSLTSPAVVTPAAAAAAAAPAAAAAAAVAAIAVAAAAAADMH